MLKFLKFLKKSKDTPKQSMIDDITTRIVEFKRHQAKERLKIWQQTHLH